ncbi:MAG: hypothetical protein AABW79_01595 [Nanoarchaeota archaeon]
MKIKPYLHKLQGSDAYKDFQQKNKDAFLTAGFFVIDFESGNNVHQIDYFVPSKKKFAAFTLDKKVALQLFDMIEKKTPEPLDIGINIDLEALHGILQDEMRNRNITSNIKKMIAVIQNVKGKKVWSVSCILSGMDIIKAHIEDESQTVLKLEKSSLFDYIQKMPGLQPQGSPAQTQAQPQVIQGNSSDSDAIKAKLEQLDKLKEVLKKEQEEIQKQQAKEAKAKPVKKKSK